MNVRSYDKASVPLCQVTKVVNWWSSMISGAGEFCDPLLHPKVARFYSSAYLGRHDATDPLISPVYGDWRGLPPLLVHAGEDEFLARDAVRVEELARAAGVDVRLKIYPRMWHVWQLYLGLSEARGSLDEIARFLNAHLE